MALKDLFKIYGTIGINNDEANKKLDETTQKGKSTAQSLANGFESIGNVFSKVGEAITSAGKACSVVTAGVTGVITASALKAKDFIGVFESARAIFERKLGTTGADEMYNSLLNIAKGSRYAQEYIVSAGQTLIAMGVDANDTAQYVQVATDAMSGMGKSGAELQEMAEMFGKMSIQTTLYTEDLNQMLTSGIRVYDILAAKYGTSTDAIKEMASAGQLTSEDFKYLMDVLSGNVAGMEEFSMAGLALAGKSGTLTGAIDSLNSSFRSFALNITGTNINKGQMENYNKLKDVVTLLGSTLEKVGEKFSFVSDWIGNGLDFLNNALQNFNTTLDTMSPETLERITKAVAGLAAAGPILLAVGQGVSTVGSLFQGLSGATKSIGAVTGAISGFVQKTGLVKTAVIKAQNSLIDLPGVFGTAFTGIFSVLDGKGSLIMSTFTKVFAFGGVIALIVAGLGLIQQNFGDQIAQIAQVAIEKGPEILNNLVNGIVSKLPELVTLGVQLLQTLVDVITANLPMLIQGAVLIITTLVTALLNNLPQILQMGLQLIVSLAQGLIQAIPLLVGYIPQIINSILTTLITFLPQLLEAGVQILTALINGLVSAIPTLVQMIPTVISNIVMAVVNNLSQIIDAGINIMISLITGLIGAIPQLIIAIPSIIINIVQTLWNNRGQILDAGGKIIISLVEGIISFIGRVSEAVQQVQDKIKEKLGELKDKALEWGKDMLQGFIDGIKNKIQGLGDAVKNVADKVTSFLHFSRPDEGPLREYEQWMPDMVQGLAKTLNDSAPMLYNTVNKLAEKVTAGLDFVKIPDNLKTSVAGSVEWANNDFTAEPVAYKLQGNKQFIESTTNNTHNDNYSKLLKLLKYYLPLILKACGHDIYIDKEKLVAELLPNIDEGLFL